MKAFPLFKDRYSDFQDQSLLIEGEVPKDLSGRLYRVGMGQFSQFGERHKHWFDGDGAIVKLSFQDGKATHSLKLLNCTPDEEAKAGKMILGRFGRAPVGLHRRLKSLSNPSMFVNSANTSIFQLNQKLCALWEAGHPTEIHFETLARLGIINFDSAIKRSFSAHPKRHPKQPVHFNFGVRFFPKPMIDLYKIPETGKVEHLGSIPFSGSAFLHDFAITEKYAIFMVTPVFLGIFDYLFKGASINDAFQWKPEKNSEIIVVELGHISNVKRMTGPAGFFTHSINAFETKAGKIAVDFVTYPNADDLKRIAGVIEGKVSASEGKPTRWMIDPQKSEVKQEPLLDWVCEVPTLIEKTPTGETLQFAGLGFRDNFSKANEMYDCVGIYDVGQRGLRKMVFDGDTVCEANYVIGSRGKYLIVQCYSIPKDISYFAIIKLGRNPELVAKLWSQAALPYTIHGSWIAN